MSVNIAPIEPDALITLVASELGFELPESCIPGVIEALAVIAYHARIVEGEA